MATKSSFDVVSAFKSIIHAKRRLKKSNESISNPKNADQCESLRISLALIPNNFCFFELKWIDRIVSISQKYSLICSSLDLLQLTQSYLDEPGYIPEFDMTVNDLVSYHHNHCQLEESRNDLSMYTDRIMDMNTQRDVDMFLDHLLTEEFDEFDVPLPFEKFSIETGPITADPSHPPAIPHCCNPKSIFKLYNNQLCVEYFIICLLLKHLRNGTITMDMLDKYKIPDIPYLPPSASITSTMISVPLFNNELNTSLAHRKRGIKAWSNSFGKHLNDDEIPFVLFHTLVPNVKPPTANRDYKLKFTIHNVNTQEGSKIRFLENHNNSFPIIMGTSLTTNNSVSAGNVYFINCNNSTIYFPKIHIGCVDNREYSAGVGIAHTYGTNKAISIGQDGSMETWFVNDYNELELRTPRLNSKPFDEMTDVHAYSVDRPYNYELELAVTSANVKTNNSGINIVRIDKNGLCSLDKVGNSKCKYDQGNGLKVTAIEFGRGKSSRYLFASFAKMENDTIKTYGNRIRRWDKLEAVKFDEISIDMPKDNIEICSLKSSPCGSYLGVGCTDNEMTKGGITQDWPGYLVDPFKLEIIQIYSVDSHDNNFVSFDINENYIIFSNSTDKIRIYDIEDAITPLLELYHSLPLKRNDYDQKTILRKIGPRSKVFIEMGELIGVDDAHISYCGVNQNSIHWISDYEFTTPAFGGIYFYNLLLPDPLYYKIPVDQPLNSFAIHPDGYLAFTDVMKNFYFYSYLDLEFPATFKRVVEYDS
eukprot:NODE_448_length_8440_cov_0.772329.p1 type:complete len:760 gc:universal NODE_448_length_8440_cov_0.772329:5824-3545(-)